MKKIFKFCFDLINIFCLEYSMVTISESKLMGKDTFETITIPLLSA